MIQWATLGTGLVSAGLWFWSALIKVEFGGYGGLGPENRRKLALQARLNAAAAILTGITTLLGAISTQVIPK
jgi:hypothetical protein